MALTQIERNFGKGSIVRLGDATKMKVETISSGALTLDLALGGGLPKGRVIEIYGPESSGKTTVALHAIAEIQKSGGIAAFVDAEHALDPTYAASVGVDIENLLVSQPDSGEMGLEIVDQLVRSTAVDIVVVDSVAALVPRAEIEGQMGESQIGLQARLMSHALRKITREKSPKISGLYLFCGNLWFIRISQPTEISSCEANLEIYLLKKAIAPFFLCVLGEKRFLLEVPKITIPNNSGHQQPETFKHKPAPKIDDFRRWRREHSRNIKSFAGIPPDY